MRTLTLTEPDGTVWFGTSGGLARRRPYTQPESVVPETRITSVLRDGQPAAGTAFDWPAYSLELRFTLLAYREQPTSFRYRLGGNGVWTRTQAHDVRFAGLPPGAYRFEAQGEAAPGEWGRPAVFEFHISPPWFLSRPFSRCPAGGGGVLRLGVVAAAGGAPAGRSQDSGGGRRGENQGAGRGYRQGRTGQPVQRRIPGQHEPRNADPVERRHRPDAAGSGSEQGNRRWRGISKSSSSRPMACST